MKRFNVKLLVNPSSRDCKYHTSCHSSAPHRHENQKLRTSQAYESRQNHNNTFISRPVSNCFSSFAFLHPLSPTSDSGLLPPSFFFVLVTFCWLYCLLLVQDFFLGHTQNPYFGVCFLHRNPSFGVSRKEIWKRSHVTKCICY
jgi:hypothetical protein